MGGRGTQKSTLWKHSFCPSDHREVVNLWRSKNVVG